METRDDILYGILKLRQPKTGARVNCDTVLLAAFPCFSRGRRANFVEFGSASGAVSLLLAKRFENLKITGLEIQNEAVELSKMNALENGLDERANFQEFDIKNFRTLSAQSFDGVVVNPPYKNLGAGRVSTREADAIARQEINCTLEDVVHAAKWLLKSRGHFFCVFTAPRMAELLSLLVQNSIEPKRIRFVHPRAGAAAGIFLLEAIKDGGSGGLAVEPPLVIYGSNGEYTQEFLSAYTLEGLAKCY